MKLSTQQAIENPHIGATKLSTPSQAQGQLSPTTHSKASLTRLVENTLDSLARRIGESGNSVKDILLLAVVLQSVRGRGSAETKQQWMMQGANKALSACRQYLLPAVAELTATFEVSIIPDISGYVDVNGTSANRPYDYIHPTV
jgi:hypothetical protein